MEQITPIVAPEAGRGERFAATILQVGTILVVLAASPTRAFDLDRFLVPKEIVLHATAFVAAVFGFRAIRRGGGGWVDVLLGAFLVLTIASGVFATNLWLAFRALAVTASSILLFWIARGLREAGLGRRIVNTLAFAVVLTAVTSLAQAYGVELDVFSPNRSPGGTLGNRNFIAHAAAFGLPLCVFAAVHARRFIGNVIGSFGVAIVTGTLVLTRSRAAWLAAAAVLAILIVAMFIWKRGFTVLAFAGAGIVAALLIPNTLEWRSDNPYLDSVAGIAEYDEGSGAGRLVQYQRSLRMAAAYPLLGVGPGNWPVLYPEYAARRDPSLDRSEGGVTYNPWPSSDWVSYVSERGFAAAALLMLVFAIIAAAGARRIFRAQNAEEGFEAVTMVGTAAAAAIAGLFDAVLLLALPALIVWTALGALWQNPSPARSPRLRTMIAIVAIAIAAAGAIRSTTQLVAMEMYASGDRTLLVLAAQLDPGNYRVRLQLARSGDREERCRHASAAHALFPSAHAAEQLARRCD